MNLHHCKSPFGDISPECNPRCVKLTKVTKNGVRYFPKGIFQRATAQVTISQVGTSKCAIWLSPLLRLGKDVNVFIFFKRSFRYDNDDQKSKTKRSF